MKYIYSFSSSPNVFGLECDHLTLKITYTEHLVEG